MPPRSCKRKSAAVLPPNNATRNNKTRRFNQRFTARAVVVGNLHGFVLAKMIAATVRTKLADLVLKLRKFSGADEQVEPRGKIVALIAVSDVKRVFAMRRPFRRDAKVVADGHRRAFDRDAATEFGIHSAAFLDVALAFARARRRALDDGVDERATNRFVRDGVLRQIELEQAHGTFDVHADGAGINVRRRDEHAADGCAVIKSMLRASVVSRRPGEKFVA